MIDHTSFSVFDYIQSKKFYDETLGVLGYQGLMEIYTPTEIVRGYGASEETLFFEIRHDREAGNERWHGDLIGKAKGHHVAFRAPTIESIHEWHQKCLELGGKDNGKPGPRPEYHPGYYGAFIIDLDGWRIEACLNNYKVS